ncbi:MAG: hypothetical protein Q8N33_06110 [Rhodocyclaceae bacterium]|nr:hypothetical protein [Rhodocyclaceae bacterium]
MFEPFQQMMEQRTSLRGEQFDGNRSFPGFDVIHRTGTVAQQLQQRGRAEQPDTSMVTVIFSVMMMVSLRWGVQNGARAPKWNDLLVFTQLSPEPPGKV